MNKNEAVRDLGSLLRISLNILHDCNCNKTACSTLIQRLSLVVMTFGGPLWGLVAHSEKTSVAFPILKVNEIEELLSNYIRLYRI
jgi:hypothetical protein